MSDFKELVRGAWDAAWNRGEIDALDEILHADYALEQAGSGGTARPGLLQGIVGVQDLVERVDLATVPRGVPRTPHELLEI